MDGGTDHGADFNMLTKTEASFGSGSKPCTVPLVNIKISGKWMFIPLKMVLIGIDPYPFLSFCLW